MEASTDVLQTSHCRMRFTYPAYKQSQARDRRMRFAYPAYMLPEQRFVIPAQAGIQSI
ncbi:MAG: hypothetical protein PF630_00575 [Gammaproteobacteria bacterium]|jgi:hypothetical protein|nr:hypothetical protein [Gammaproteobacteria bacterium]